MNARLQLWRPLGRVFEPQSQGAWGVTHAALPTPLLLDEGLVRVFFSMRDSRNRSSLASLDLEISGPRWRVVGNVRGPLLSPGVRGAFDADGVTLSCIVRREDHLLAYYLGWRAGGDVPFTNFIGLAQADLCGEHFERIGRAPIVGRSEIDPFSVGYPWVVDRGRGFQMWYGSHLYWGPQSTEMMHVLKEARSDDGLRWQPTDHVAVNVAGAADPDEFAISRPCVLDDSEGGYSMWYARRYSEYRLGYAVSPDGKNWSRKDHLIAFDGAPKNWEVRARTYPAVFDLGGDRYMLYNGDGYGRSGFGLAIL